MSQTLPVLSIVGTTAVGKTDFALLLAERLLEIGVAGVDIISADSRQIYQGLEILSGADIPEGFEKQKDLEVSAFSFFQKGSIKLFGVSCIKPDVEWSVAQFQIFAQQLITFAQEKKHAVLMVGGTGMYHDHVFNTDKTLHIPPNLELRELTKTLTVAELQELLEKSNPSKLQTMNNSDKNNPRRLVRAIEIANYPQAVNTSSTQQNFNHYTVQLSASLEYIVPKIKDRIEHRLEHSVLEEVSELKQYGERLTEQVSTTLGFDEVEKLLEKKYSETEAKEKWLLAEKQYAQRQLTWWKSKTNIKSFTVDSNSDWKSQALDYCLDLFRVS